MIKCKIYVCWKYPMYQLLSFSLPLTYISMARTHPNTCQLGWLWAPTYTKMQADRSVTMPPTPKQELNKSGTKIQCLTNRVTVMQNVQLLLTTATKSRQIHLGDVNKIIDLSTSPPLRGLGTLNQYNNMWNCEKKTAVYNTRHYFNHFKRSLFKRSLWKLLWKQGGGKRAPGNCRWEIWRSDLKVNSVWCL